MDSYKKIALFVVLCCSINGFGQEFNVQIKVKDSLSGIHTMFYNLLAYNTRSKETVLGSVDGNISIQGKMNDTIKVSSLGYGLSVCYVKDSVIQLDVSATIAQLGTVSITARTPLEELKLERASLALKETRTVTGAAMAMSPITALYEAFSKTGKAKRLVAQMEYEDSKAKVLKELFRLYVDEEIILLEEDEFEDFILFMNINEEVLKKADDNDLIMYIKGAFREYRRLNDYYFVE